MLIEKTSTKIKSTLAWSNVAEKMPFQDRVSMVPCQSTLKNRHQRWFWSLQRKERALWRSAGTTCSVFKSNEGWSWQPYNRALNCGISPNTEGHSWREVHSNIIDGLLTMEAVAVHNKNCEAQPPNQEPRDYKTQVHRDPTGGDHCMSINTESDGHCLGAKRKTMPLLSRQSLPNSTGGVSWNAAWERAGGTSFRKFHKNVVWRSECPDYG